MNQTSKSYTSASVKKLEGSRVEITGSIESAQWEKYRSQALKEINESITVDGFRKGMIPENILVSKVGESAILEEMAEFALSKAYIDILVDNKIDAIGKPEVQVTKLAAGNPLEFVATTAVVPEVKLPDYKKISAEIVKKQNPDDEKFTEKDLEDTIKRIVKGRAPESPIVGDSKEQDSLAPEITDEFVKTLGDFSDVEDFKSKLRVMIAEEKKNSAREKLRIKIADGILDAAKFDIPSIMIESEVNRTQSQFETDIERMGVKLEDYLKHAKKKIEDLREEWKPSAEKKARLQLILNSIAVAENLKPSNEEVESEVDHIVEHYKDADRERAAIYAESVLTNEKVFEMLEKQSN